MMKQARHPITLAVCLLLITPGAVFAQAAAFVPSEFEAKLETAHQNDSPEHVLTIQKITGQVENMNTGKVTISSVTQILDCKTGKLLSQSRCDPCEYNVAEWPKRPVDRWFAERSWPDGSHVARQQAELQLAHFTRYFKLTPADGTSHQGFTYAFWNFDGRRGTPLVHRKPKTVKVAKNLIETKKPRFGPVQKIEIFNGPNNPDTLDYPTDGRSLHLSAVASATPRGQSSLARTDTFSALWSTSCATLSSSSTKQVVVTLKDDSDRCVLHLFEGHTGVEDAVTIIRRHTKPKIRVAITFEGGREADGVALKGNIRSIDLEAHAFDPAGNPLPGFTPEWGIDCGKVEFLDQKNHLRLRLHLDPGVKRCEVHAREPKSSAEDVFMIEVSAAS